MNFETWISVDEKSVDDVINGVYLNKSNFFVERPDIII